MSQRNNNRNNQTAKPPESENVGQPTFNTNTPGVGLGLPVSETSADDSERHSEDQPPSAPSPAAVNLPPARAEDLRETRVTYKTKTGGTVQSITKADRSNRTAQNAVYVVCNMHHVACGDPKSEGIFTRYYCPVEGCKFSHKLVKPTVAEKINARRKKDDQTPNPQTDISPR